MCEKLGVSDLFSVDKTFDVSESLLLDLEYSSLCYPLASIPYVKKKSLLMLYPAANVSKE